MAEEKAKTGSPKSKVRVAPYKVWAKERKQIPTSLGAAVALGIDEKAKITEAEFEKYLKEYGAQPSAVK